jgi:hypothetical protein
VNETGRLYFCHRNNSRYLSCHHNTIPAPEKYNSTNSSSNSGGGGGIMVLMVVTLMIISDPVTKHLQSEDSGLLGCVADFMVPDTFKDGSIL